MNLQRLIEQYISLQQSLGSPFTTNATILRAFGRVCGARCNVANVSPKQVDSFLGKKRPVTMTWFSKLNRLRPFFQYAASRGHISKAPLPLAMPKRPSPFVPYIYAPEELRRLLQLTEAYSQSRCLEAMTIRTMILAFYGAGLRLSEAIHLTCADVDLSSSVLTIRHTKFGKTRLVPVGRQLNQALIQYDGTRPSGRPTTAPFFATRAGGPVPSEALQDNFRVLCDRAGIRRTDGTRQQPRIHDLRHTFAVHRLTSWYQEGADVQRLLHQLSVYLGHVELRHTQVYLSMTPELLQEASQRFERYAGKERSHG